MALSKKESIVVALVLTQDTIADVARIMNISEKGVKYHLGNIYKKTNFNSKNHIISNMAKEINKKAEIIDETDYAEKRNCRFPLRTHIKTPIPELASGNANCRENYSWE